MEVLGGPGGRLDPNSMTDGSIVGSRTGKECAEKALAYLPAHMLWTQERGDLGGRGGWD